MWVAQQSTHHAAWGGAGHTSSLPLPMDNITMGSGNLLQDSALCWAARVGYITHLRTRRKCCTSPRLQPISCAIRGTR